MDSSVEADAGGNEWTAHCVRPLALDAQRAGVAFDGAFVEQSELVWLKLTSERRVDALARRHARHERPHSEKREVMDFHR
jgi:hypothetical protein